MEEPERGLSGRCWERHAFRVNNENTDQLRHGYGCEFHEHALGGTRSHDERSESQSAISDSITVNAGHITGSYSRDVAHANGALTDKFDAQKLQNQIRASQLGT